MSLRTPPAPIADSCRSSPIRRTLPPRIMTSAIARSRLRVSAIPASSMMTRLFGSMAAIQAGAVCSRWLRLQVSLARVSQGTPSSFSSALAAAADGASPTTVPPDSVHADPRTRMAVVLLVPAGAMASWTRRPEQAMSRTRSLWPGASWVRWRALRAARDRPGSGRRRVHRHNERTLTLLRPRLRRA